MPQRCTVRKESRPKKQDLTWEALSVPCSMRFRPGQRVMIGLHDFHDLRGRFGTVIAGPTQILRDMYTCPMRGFLVKIDRVGVAGLLSHEIRPVPVLRS